jgi:hypothetical protein
MSMCAADLNPLFAGFPLEATQGEIKVRERDFWMDGGIMG